MTSAVLVARPRERAAVRNISCSACTAREQSFCHVLAHAMNLPRVEVPRPVQEIRTVPARRFICRKPDFLTHVPIICRGWAMAGVLLSDGSRQILSFLLPGDFASPALLFDPRPNCFVEAITDVTYRAFRRGDLKDLIFADPDLAERLSRLWVDEKRRADETIVDLGRRPAAERIARLILGLVERLEPGALGSGRPVEVEFPLRQHHIADAIGLTPVHVSKLLTEFRRNGLIRLSERSLTILDTARFRAVAQLR